MWNCPVCDTQNTEQYSRCEVCKTPRPSLSRANPAKATTPTRSSRETSPIQARERRTSAQSSLVSPPSPAKKKTHPVADRFDLFRTFVPMFRTGFLFLVVAVVATAVYFAGTLALNIVHRVGDRISSVLKEINVSLIDDSSNPTNTSDPYTTETSSGQPVVTPQATDVTFLDPSICSKIFQVGVRDTAKGDILTIYCQNSVSYRLDPLAKGNYVVASSGQFIVYVTFGGDVYAARAGNRYLTHIGDFREFYMVRIDGNVALDISIDGNNPYFVNVYESTMKERKKFLIPKEISK